MIFRIFFTAIVTVFMTTSFAFAPSFANQEKALESKIQNMPYDKARAIILKSGWKPIKNKAPNELGFVGRDMYDKGFIEVGSCAGSGMAPCNFYFTKNDNQFLGVYTIGEEYIVSGLEVMNAKEYKAARPF